ncbi:MAG: type IV secretion system DNA-binding domain-containing protein, partial [Lacipirellulaceae bacterium]
MSNYLLNHARLGNPHFWHHYTGVSLKSAITIAKTFPTYWLHQHSHSTNNLHFQYDEIAAAWDALSWAFDNEELKRICEGISKAKSVLIDLEKYLERIDRGAADSQDAHYDYVHALHKDQDSWVETFNAEQRRWVEENKWELVYKVPGSEWFPFVNNGASVTSGAPLVSQNSLMQIYGIRGDATLDHLRFGALLLPYEEARKAHFCIVGMPRSGKTVTIRLLIESLGTHRKKEQQKVRFVTYDRKGELYPILQGVPRHPAYKDRPPGTFLLNPFDKRGVAWDIAADAKSLHFAREIAKILIPSTGHEKPYFVNAPRELLAAAIMSLRELRGKLWTLMDLLIACKPANLQAVLSKSPTGRDAIESYLRSPHGSSADILS